MSKLLTTAAAIGIAATVALPSVASARPNVDAGMKTSNSIEVSSARRIYHRNHYGHYGYRHYGYRHYYGPRYGSYGGYGAYAYDPYYRPYYRPGVSVGVGPFGFGFGF